MALRFDQGTLLLGGPGPGAVLPAPLAWDRRVGAWRCEAIAYPSLAAELRARFGTAFVDRVPPPAAVTFPRVDLPTLRSEQQRSLAAWLGAGRRGVVVMPTGTGKTVVALAAMAELGVSTLVVAPVRDLMYQWHQRILEHLGCDAGIVGDRLFDTRAVTVTTYDSAYIHMPTLGERFALIVFDEAHHLPGPSRRDAARFAIAPYRLGLTATPERSDGRHEALAALVGPTVHRIGIGAVKGRTLADYNVVRIPVRLSPQEQADYDQASASVRGYMAKRCKETPRFNWQQLLAEVAKDPEARAAQKAYYRKQSIEDRAEEKLRVLEDLFRLHFGERVLVFAGSNRMAMIVSRRFLVPTLLSHSRKQERRAMLGGFAEGRFPVLVANRVLDEGVDVPEAKVAVVIGGQASTRQAKQRLGRILRRSGDAVATLYEVVCAETKDVQRSRSRRRSDAYEAAEQFRIAEGKPLAYGRPRHRRL